MNPVARPSDVALCPSFSSASHDRDQEQGEHRFDHVADRQCDSPAASAESSITLAPVPAAAQCWMPCLTDRRLPRRRGCRPRGRSARGSPVGNCRAFRLKIGYNRFCANRCRLVSLTTAPKSSTVVGRRSAGQAAAQDQQREAIRRRDIDGKPVREIARSSMSRTGRFRGCRRGAPTERVNVGI
jgi:hypothetical protein